MSEARDPSLFRKRVVYIVAAALANLLFLCCQWILEKFGFTRHGVHPGSVAASWRTRYPEVVPTDSLFYLFLVWGIHGIPRPLKTLLAYVMFVVLIFFFS